jgi:hypothetical protein
MCSAKPAIRVQRPQPCQPVAYSKVNPTRLYGSIPASREADRNGELPGPMRLAVAAWLHRKHAYPSGGRHVAADEEL